MNNPYSSGTPDFWFSGAKRDLWVEYKWLPRNPARGVVTPKKLLTPLQCDWLDGRYAEGRSVAVIVGCPAGGVILTKGGWNNEYSAAVFNSLVIDRKALAAWIQSQVM